MGVTNIRLLLLNTFLALLVRQEPYRTQKLLISYSDGLSTSAKQRYKKSGIDSGGKRRVVVMEQVK